MITEKATRKHLYSRPPLDPNVENSLVKIARRIPHGSTVLDVGCAVGMLGQYLTEHQGCSVDGIEGNAEAAEIARPFYRRVAVTDLESAVLRDVWEGVRYDRIVCADVLEHLRDPGQVLCQLSDLLAPSGKLLISIPNIAHVGVFLELLSGDFRYREEGLLDRTHLRFFTRRSFLYFLAENGFAGQIVDRIVVDLQHSEFSAIPLEIISPSLLREMQDWDDNITYQFIVEAYHQEIGESVTPIFPVDKAVSHGPRFACQVFWRSNDELFTEHRSQRIYLPVGVDRQRVDFTLPKGLVQALRFDPSEQKGFLRVYTMRLYDGAECLWTWDGNIETLLRGTLHSIFPAPLKTGEVGVVLSLLDEDPWLELPVPPEILSRAEHLEVELSWPMSADYMAVQEEWEDLLKQNQRLAMELDATQQSSQVRAGELTATLQTAEEHNQHLSSELVDRELKLSETKNLLHKRNEDNARLSKEIGSIQSSLSWRVTKPGRLLAKRFKHFLRKIGAESSNDKEYLIIATSGLFNRRFYKHTYQDVAKLYIDPLYHYCRYGWREGRNPSPYFDTRFYLEKHKDVHDSGINPLVHYIRFGHDEGRAANPKGITINGAGKDKQILRIVELIRKNPELLKRFIREMRRNGIKHAVKKVRAAAQRHSAQPTTAIKDVTDLWNLFSPAQNIPQLDADMAIDIIIPVYNGKKYLEPLFSSIISNTMPPYRLLIADDKSTDADILPLLYAIKSKNPDVDITIIENNENMGFVKTVNKLAQLAHGNFVLLNTDVEVPPSWLERLIYPLVKMDGVASTTPFTNSGTICSFPNYLQDNDLPSGMDVKSVDHAFSFVKFSNNIIDIPTGVGFCMGINKAVWDEIGGFDEVFGKGYGEENDWCMRASRFGYRNLHVPNLFVYHKHGGSFLTEDKERYQKNNLAIINERYPDYSGKVQQLIENDAFSFLRKCALAKALCEKYGSIAIFDHDLGGGANQYVAESLSNHKVSIIVRYNTIRCEFEASFRSDNISDLTIKADTLLDIKSLVSFFNVDELVINNLVSYPNVIDFIDFLCELTDRRIHWTYMMHDFYAICPMYNLINYEMKYCEVPDDHDYCNRCLKSNPLIRKQVSYISSEYPNLSISDWRMHFGRLLDLADKIVFFSHSSLAIASKAYPELCLRPDKLEVKPHKVTWVRPVATGALGDVINIGIIGVMTFTKGIHIVSALAGYIDSCQLNYRVHVFGEVADPQISLEQYPCVTLYGKYERNELPLLMEQAHIDIVLIPSIWPETFSYTTEEAFVMNLPVAVFDIGAPGERVRGYAKGIILRDRSPRAILDSIGEYFGRLPITQRDAGQKQEDEIVFVCVSNNEHMYQRCVDASSFMTAHRIIKYDNSEHNVPIPKRYNSAISELLDTGYHGWIFFVHNDFAIMESLSPIVKQLPKEAVYGPIGAILDNGKKQIYGEILQGHNGALVAHGTKIDCPSPVDTVDCQCIFFHSDTVRKYPLRFDEADPLAFHQYAEEFCLTAKDQTGMQTYAVQVKCKHLSWGRTDESFDRAIQYINRKHGKRRWAGTCTHLDQS